jgi:hypothetical protein
MTWRSRLAYLVEEGAGHHEGAWGYRLTGALHFLCKHWKGDADVDDADVDNEDTSALKFNGTNASNADEEDDVEDEEDTDHTVALNLNGTNASNVDVDDDVPLGFKGL